MGDRISIQFKNGNEKSVVLFSHWDGINFRDIARDYINNLQQITTGEAYPLGRGEPNTIMVDFIRHLCKYQDLEQVESNYYLGATELDGDNSDNGHHIIEC